jgi:hypothetical protein
MYNKNINNLIETYISEATEPIKKEITPNIFVLNEAIKFGLRSAPYDFKTFYIDAFSVLHAYIIKEHKDKNQNWLKQLDGICGMESLLVWNDYSSIEGTIAIIENFDKKVKFTALENCEELESQHSYSLKIDNFYNKYNNINDKELSYIVELIFKRFQHLKTVNPYMIKPFIEMQDLTGHFLDEWEGSYKTKPKVKTITAPSMILAYVTLTLRNYQLPLEEKLKSFGESALLRKNWVKNKKT